ncbi:hypothetical protein HYH03_001142 [Edaphochlamys debaryana]|uniref:Uncharacterized protein n=1 Tax=Edaphochlamys debaryana TaxID=47281 RepID=A0A835YGJ1_9CHLO|nr:hypothetical protein HYH03_001142 [Edaphochlamys debaryana]|eukprot:KAG2501352.1 hypothetical protein HYH03_001142 [Edaphochlamys debaryana]
MDVESSLSPALKRRRLAAAPPGQGPPANPVPAVLFNPTLLAKIWPTHRYRLRGRELAGPSPCEAVEWALGMLRRGRRPRVVDIEIKEEGPVEWRQGALGLLRAIPQLSGRPGEGVACLQLPAQLLSPSAAPLIAGAFPNLSRLEMTAAGELSPDASHEAARGLALLLKGAEGAEGSGASAGVGGEEAGEQGGEGSGGGPSSSPARVLPRLTALKLSLSQGTLKSLPPSFGTVLRQAPQLRTLELPGHELIHGEDQERDARGPLEELASLTQLTALSLRACAPSLLPVLTAALTRLTSLQLTSQGHALPPALFAPLQGLQRLDMPCASLEVAGLAEALSSLTRLGVRVFTLPAQELSQPLTSIPRWQLPAGLRELALCKRGCVDVPPEVFAGLELPAGLLFDQESSLNSFVLRPGCHTAPPVEEEGFAGTELLPAAEEALCGALRFVRRHGLFNCREVCITYKAQASDLLLQPVGGAAGTGPGRPNHGRWLREAAALRPTHLKLEGIRLSYQDVEIIAEEMVDLESLSFKTPSEVAFPAFPLLAIMPHLSDIEFDATCWARPDAASAELRVQAIASLLALARELPEGRPPTVGLCYGGGLSHAAEERVRSIGLRAREQMRACGVRRILITAGGFYVDSDPEDSD